MIHRFVSCQKGSEFIKTSRVVYRIKTLLYLKTARCTRSSFIFIGVKNYEFRGYSFFKKIDLMNV